MSFTVIIPSRFASTRLPGKALVDIAGLPLIVRVVLQVRQSKASRIIVATDDQRIGSVLQDIDCEVCITREDHQSGSDRLAEVVEILALDDQEIIVNVQGDEPMIPPRLINEVADSLIAMPSSVMATAAHQIKSTADFENPSVVKVVFDQKGRALYFSRAGIPFSKHSGQINAWHHIGIYVYRAEFLKRYSMLKPSVLEQQEGLEQLRVMDNGEHILVQAIDYDAGIGVDTHDDLARVRRLLKHATDCSDENS